MARPEFIPEHGFGTVSRPGWEEILQPPAVEYAPVTWGWWALFVLVLGLVVYGVVRYRNWRVANQYRADALRELTQLEAAALQADAAAIRQVMVLLKRVAVHAFGRKDVAPLAGAKWAEFLHQTCPETSFSAPLLETLTYKGCDGVEPQQIKELLHHVATWIRRHDASV